MTSAVTALLAACSVAAVAGNLQTVNQWNLLQYDVPFNYPNADSYKPEVTVPTGFEVGEWTAFVLPRLEPRLENSKNSIFYVISTFCFH